MDGYTFIVLMFAILLVFILIIIGLVIWDRDNENYWRAKH